MVLVDTSVFIGYFRKRDGVPYRKMGYLIENEMPYGICNYVYQELLQGVQNNDEFELLKDYLGGLPFFDLKYGKRSFEDAARMCAACRKKGIAVRSTIDLLIAQIAVENNLLLLHNDADYVRISEVSKALKFF